MTPGRAAAILKEHNLWRRGIGPYSYSNPDTARAMPYEPNEIGEAIDTAVRFIEKYEEK